MTLYTLKVFRVIHNETVPLGAKSIDGAKRCMRQYIPSTSASAEQKKLRAVVDETVAIVLYEDNYPVLECGAPDWKIKPANGPGLL